MKQRNETMMSELLPGKTCVGARVRRRVKSDAASQALAPVNTPKWEGLIWSLKGNPTQELQEIS